MTAKATDARGGLGLALAVLLALLVGCAQSAPLPPRSERPTRTLEPNFDGGPVLPPADMSGAGPGSLVEVKPLQFTESFDQMSATVVRVIYRSTSGFDNAPTQVSGVVVVPPGAPPHGGWPILAVGHILTGIAGACAPSLASELGGYAAILALFASNGYVVALSDYEGLGVDGYRHMPLQAATLGNNLIDSVRAARHVVPDTSTQWAAYGIGQGGLASWAAAEQASSYGGGLNMVGSVALAPLADMSGMANDAFQGTLPREQYFLYLSVLQSLAESTVALNLDDYQSPAVRANVDVSAKCAPLDPAGLADAVSALQPNDIRPRDAAAMAKLRDEIASTAVPLKGQGPAAPVLVVYATEDPTVRASWIVDAARRACAEGDPIEMDPLVGESNTGSDVVTQEAFGWLQARFQNQKLGNVCVGVS